jgi:hypothetical protein
MRYPHTPILLLLAFTGITAQGSTDGEETTTPSDIAEAMIHVWYSASISSGVLS